MENESRAAEHLTDEIQQVINRFRMEYRMTYAEAVGVLEIVKTDLINEALDEE